VTSPRSTGEVGADVEARTVLVAACAPVFYEVALMRGPVPADLAERYARVAATSFLAV
jgi:hypothetical protein